MIPKKGIDTGTLSRIGDLLKDDCLGSIAIGGIGLHGKVMQNSRKCRGDVQLPATEDGHFYCVAYHLLPVPEIGTGACSKPAAVRNF